jgi:hypothetical protein
MLQVFLHDAGNIFDNDLCAAIKIQIEGGKSHEIKPEQREELINAYVKRLLALGEEVKKYWIMLGNLQAIAFVLERQKFTFKKLERFHEHKKVASCVEDVKNMFKDELENLKKMG